MMSLHLCSTSDVITFDQISIIYNQLLQGKDIFNDNEIRVIVSMEPEIWTKMLRNLIEKVGAKFPLYSMAEFARLDCAFSEVFWTGSKFNKKKQQNESLKTKATFSKFWFLHMPE